jgi:hypothetical protein
MVVISKQRHYEAGRTRDVGDIYEVSDERARQLGALVEPYGGNEDAPVAPPDGPPADKAMRRTRRNLKVK